MELSQEQIIKIASNILIADVLNYINEHQTEYEEFLKQKKQNYCKD